LAERGMKLTVKEVHRIGRHAGQAALLTAAQPMHHVTT
jgi:hypothetical protein